MAATTWFPFRWEVLRQEWPLLSGALLPQEQADIPRPAAWMAGPCGALRALCLCSSSGTKDDTSSLFWPACHMEPFPGSDPSTMGAERQRREAVGTTLPAPLGASARCSCRDSQGQTAERRDQCLLASGEASIATRAARLLRNLGTSKFTEQGKALGNPAGLSSFWLSLGEGQGALGSAELGTEAALPTFFALHQAAGWTEGPLIGTESWTPGRQPAIQEGRHRCPQAAAATAPTVCIPAISQRIRPSKSLWNYMQMGFFFLN